MTRWSHEGQGELRPGWAPVCLLMQKCQRRAELQQEREEGGLETRGRAVSHQQGEESWIHLFR